MKSEVQLYLDNTFNLARSLVIKSLDTANLTNKTLIKTFGKTVVDLEDPTTWKYYLNLFGEYYSVIVDAETIPIDTVMTIESLDTGETISFDKVTLISHPTTAFSYRNNRDRIKNLVSLYPGQQILINGILNPIEINTAINAEDMEIINYNSELIDGNEISLLLDLQKWIYAFNDRWSIRAYTLVDELYLAGQLSILYLNLVPRILNIRLSKCLTEEAHSFHISSYLKSHHGINLDITGLDSDLKLWLYKNIAYLERNVGKQSTLLAVIQNLFINRDLSVNKYDLRQNSNNALKNIYGTPDYIFEKKEIIKKLNAPDLDLTDDLVSVLYKETYNAEEGGFYGIVAKNRELGIIDEQIALTKNSIANTKLLEVISNKIDAIPPITETQLVLDSWMDAIVNHGYNPGVEFTDPETNTTYLINQQQALLIYSNYIAKHFKVEEAKVPIWRISMAFKYDITLNDLNTYTNRSDTFNEVLINYTSGVTDLTNMTTVTEFNAYVESLFPMFKYSWITAYITNDYIDAGTYRNSIDHMFQRKEVSYGDTNLTIKEQLGIDNLIITEKSNSDYVKSIESLIKVCTGYKIDTTFITKRIQDVHMKLFKELTSYSVQNLSGNAVDRLKTEVRVTNSMLRITKKPVRHEYKPQLTINFDEIEENYTYIDNECNAILLAEAECEDKNYILGSDDVIPGGGAIELSPMLDVTEADDGMVHLHVRTTNYETKINSVPI